MRFTRQHIDYELVCFLANTRGEQLDDTIPIMSHDLIYIRCRDGSRFVVDLTGDQFGIQDWIFDARDYSNRFVWQNILGPPPIPEGIAFETLITEASGLPSLKAAVQEALDEAQAESPIGWLKLDTQSQNTIDRICEKVGKYVAENVEKALRNSE